MSIKSAYAGRVRNGQKIFQSLEFFPVIPPPAESVVFVGNLPRDVLENDLFSFFDGCGSIYKLRIMLTRTGENKGFGFAHFFNEDDAKFAVRTLDNKPMTTESSSQRVTLKICSGNRKLFVGNIPKHYTKRRIEKCVRSIADGVWNVIIFRDRRNPTLNRGFIFVEFESHTLAAIAFEKMKGGSLYVSWAEPIEDPSAVRTPQGSTLHVKNLPLEWTVVEFATLIQPHLTQMSPRAIHKSWDYAFITFQTPQQANLAISILREVLDRYSSLQREIDVGWVTTRSL